MDILIQILILFILIGTSIKISFNRWWETIIISFAFSLFVILTYPFAILQSKTQIFELLNNNTIKQNIAVFVTFDSVLMIAFSFGLLNFIIGGTSNKWWMKILKWIPGIMIFPILFYIYLQAIFSLTGVDFETTTYSLALIILVLFPLIAIGIKTLLPDNELRCELHFVVTIFSTIIGLITTIDGTITYSAVNHPLEFKAITFAIMLFVGFFAVGYILSKKKWKFKNKI